MTKQTKKFFERVWDLTMLMWFRIIVMTFLIDITVWFTIRTTFIDWWIRHLTVRFTTFTMTVVFLVTLGFVSRDCKTKEILMSCTLITIMTIIDQSTWFITGLKTYWLKTFIHTFMITILTTFYKQTMMKVLTQIQQVQTQQQLLLKDLTFRRMRPMSQFTTISFTTLSFQLITFMVDYSVWTMTILQTLSRTFLDSDTLFRDETTKWTTFTTLTLFTLLTFV